jgi:hypothetical protein
MTANRSLLSWLVWLILGVGMPAGAHATSSAMSTPAAEHRSQAPGVGQDGPTQANPGQAATDKSLEEGGQTLPPVEQRRHLSRRFPAGKTNRSFALDTRYGHVQINAWNKQEIKVETDLIARAETSAAAGQILDALGVQYLAYDASTGGVSVSSQFGAALRGSCGGGRRYEVNYTIWLPRTLALRVAASFADVVLAGDWQGPTQLAVDYGSLRAQRLAATRNVVRIANGDATIAYVKQACLEANYAHLRLTEGEQVELRTNYADVDMGTVQDLTVHSKYGDVALGKVRNLRGSSGYSRFSVDKLSEGLDMAVRYCPNFEVRDMGANFRQINLDGGYSTIRLGFAEETPSFQFDVSTEQGQLLVDKNLVRVLSSGGSSQGIADVLGVYGGRVPARGAGSVNIKVRHGTVRFSK